MGFSKRETMREVCMQPCGLDKDEINCQMYDIIYNELAEARVAINFDEPMFIDRNGREVEEDKRFGLKQDMKITHPHYIMFANETGCNTSQKKDGHVGGTNFIVEHGTVPQVMLSDTDHRFILLPFTSASDELTPVHVSLR